MGMTTQRNRKPARPEALSSQQATLRMLGLGGGSATLPGTFGRYPEGIFASVRFMVVLTAVRS